MLSVTSSPSRFTSTVQYLPCNANGNVYDRQSVKTFIAPHLTLCVPKDENFLYSGASVNGMGGAYVEYTDGSTSEDPIVRIRGKSDEGPVDKIVHLNDVDPQNCTYAELRALLNHKKRMGEYVLRGNDILPPAATSRRDDFESRNWVQSVQTVASLYKRHGAMGMQTVQMCEYFLEVCDRIKQRNSSVSMSTGKIDEGNFEDGIQKNKPRTRLELDIPSILDEDGNYLKDLLFVSGAQQLEEISREMQGDVLVIKKHVGEYVQARYAPESTDEDPIAHIWGRHPLLGEVDYCVHLNDVDPRNCNNVEFQALAEHKRKTGQVKLYGLRASWYPLPPQVTLRPEWRPTALGNFQCRNYVQLLQNTANDYRICGATGMEIVQSCEYLANLYESFSRKQEDKQIDFLLDYLGRSRIQYKN